MGWVGVLDTKTDWLTHFESESESRLNQLREVVVKSEKLVPEVRDI
jgi:hypothetical protein